MQVVPGAAGQLVRVGGGRVEQVVQGRAGGQGGQVAPQVEQCESFQVQQGSWSGVEEGELNRLLCRELSNLFGGEQLKVMVEDGLNSRSVQG